MRIWNSQRFLILAASITNSANEPENPPGIYLCVVMILKLSRLAEACNKALGYGEAERVVRNMVNELNRIGLRRL